MKQLFYFIGGLAIISIVFVTALAFSDAPAPSPNYRYVFTSDTITNTEADTLVVPGRLLSDWSYNHAFKMTELSGTLDVTIKLQESNDYSGDTWYDVEDTGSFTTDGGIARLYGQEVLGSNTAVKEHRVRGVRQRIIITGTGTQSSVYSGTAVYKK